MPSKKKLNVGPLPEQREDYSHYEEEVILWDRIIIAGLVVLVIVIALVSFYSDEPEDRMLEKNTGSLMSQTHSEKVVALESASDSAAVPAVAEQVSEPETEAEEPVAKAEIPSEETPNAVIEATANEMEPVTLSEPSQETNTLIETGSQVETSIPDDQNKVRPASVLITNSSVKVAILNLSTDKGLPGEEVKETIIMPSKGLIKVMLRTEMHGMKGKRLYHEWYRNGKRQARVSIPVNVNKQNSHSSKFIDKYMIGSWQVKVVDTSGEPYVLADFDVVSSR